jgi:pimeloyl-ACP methyl ester carboxylesterase
MKYLIHSEAKDFLTDPPTKLVAHYAYNKTDSDFLKENKIVLDMFVDCGKDCYENGQDVEEAWEYHLFANDWKFDVKDIKVPVSIWWGELDTACVPSMGQYLAKEIPNASSHAIDGVSHMVMFTEFENILKEIVQQ